MLSHYIPNSSVFSLPICSSSRSYSSAFRTNTNRRISSSSSAYCSASMNPQSSNNKLLEFPFVSAPHRALMADIISTVETRLASVLRPCALPPDVQFYQNQTATAQGALLVRSGIQTSQVQYFSLYNNRNLCAHPPLLFQLLVVCRRLILIKSNIIY